MECVLCLGTPKFHCDCIDCLLCEKCIMSHIVTTQLTHVIKDISISKSIDFKKCDSCKKQLARISCLCQNDKTYFCSECIGAHLDINSSHCTEPIENRGSTGEIFKHQEKRRKVEYLLFEIKKNLEIIREFKKDMKKSKNELLNELKNSTQDVKGQAAKEKKYLSNLYDEVSARMMPSMKENSAADILINKTDPEHLEKMDKYMSLVDTRVQTEATIKSIKTICKFSLLLNEPSRLY